MLNHNEIGFHGALSTRDSADLTAADVISQLGADEIRRKVSIAVRRAVGMRPDHDDMVSESILRAIEHAGSYDWSKGSIMSWACRIAANCARNYCKAHNRSRVHVSAVSDEDGDQTSIFETMVSEDGRLVTERRAEMAALAAALQTLDEDTQTVLDAMTGGMGQCEAGKMVGWSPATTTRRVKAAMVALADRI
jgi:RNA polymerase sigma factor (sigma-70 family)